ncbi:TetR/AcrR family transcriptional regulator [Acidipropionibacterium jensenii]|uniref:TetR/AcrR family transcriptional regulator n=1 Tax=Acidipropionibacterium jensenii TaxID=1749 RepID=UPI00214CDAC7|nr:TetR/AcrR family transcriptional regulator [Acidipropionibacterium jensenii]
MYSPEDRTAKAIIRDAAIELFGHDGVEAVPLRAIADHAGVSQPLIIKHYGSRSGLIEAADEHALRIVEQLLHSVVIDSGGSFDSKATTDSVARLLADSPIGPYLSRLLTSHEDRARRAFGRLAEFARALVDRLAADGAIAPEVDRHQLAVVLLVHDLSVLVLRARIAEVLGADPLDRGGLESWSRTVKALYSGEALIDPSTP